jgi:hypothetical protein
MRVQIYLKKRLPVQPMMTEDSILFLSKLTKLLNPCVVNADLISYLRLLTNPASIYVQCAILYYAQNAPITQSASDVGKRSARSIQLSA